MLDIWKIIMAKIELTLRGMRIIMDAIREEVDVKSEKENKDLLARQVNTLIKKHDP